MRPHERGVAERALDVRLAIIEAPGERERMDVPAPRGELVFLPRGDQPVRIQHHHAEARAPVKRRGHRAARVARGRDQNGAHGVARLRQARHARGQKARAEILERGARAVEQLEQRARAAGVGQR
jgi:hypothetical protein